MLSLLVDLDGTWYNYFYWTCSEKGRYVQSLTYMTYNNNSFMAAPKLKKPRQEM